MTAARLPRALAAEALGTFALVFAGAGAIMVDAETDQLGHLGVALAFGLVILVMIYAVGHVSGAHLNPAVTASFALTRWMSASSSRKSRNSVRPAFNARAAAARTTTRFAGSAARRRRRCQQAPIRATGPSSRHRATI